MAEKVKIGRACRPATADGRARTLAAPHVGFDRIDRIEKFGRVEM